MHTGSPDRRNRCLNNVNIPPSRPLRRNKPHGKCKLHVDQLCPAPGSHRLHKRTAKINENKNAASTQKLAPLAQANRSKERLIERHDPTV